MTAEQLLGNYLQPHTFISSKSNWNQNTVISQQYKEKYFVLYVMFAYPVSHLCLIYGRKTKTIEFLQCAHFLKVSYCFLGPLSKVYEFGVAFGM